MYIAFLVFKTVTVVNMAMGREQNKLGHVKDIAKPRK
jgi:hypothetical protein